MTRTEMTFSKIKRRQSRRVGFLFDFGIFLACSFFCSLSWTTPAFAYVDPSVMTYTIQALAGVAVAIGAVAGVALRRTRKSLGKLFGIDENRNKIAEPSVKRTSNMNKVSAISMPLPEVFDTAKNYSKNRAQSLKSLSFGKRLVLGFVVAFFCGFTLIFVPAIEIVSGNATDMSFGIIETWIPMGLAVLACSVVVALVIALLPRKAFPVLLAILFSIGICAYIQPLFLNAGLPAADGTPLNIWTEHLQITLVSLIVWIAIIVVCMVAALRIPPQYSTKAIAAICLILCTIQTVGVVSLFVSPAENSLHGKADEIVATEEGLFDVSDKNNVIVFVLDHFAETELENLASSNPDALSGFGDFTWYQNSSGMMVPTLYAVPYMLTNQEPQVGETIVEYNRNRYLRGNFLSDMKKAGFSVGVYTASLEIDNLTNEEAARSLGDNTINLRALTERTVDYKGMISILSKASLYREMPWVLKGRFLFYTDDINNYSFSINPESTHGLIEYNTDDAAYLSTLQSQGLSIESRGSKGAYRFIHLNGSHSPYTLNEYGERVEESTRQQQNQGSLYIVRQYIDQLKLLGLYENSTIIVTADHGDWETGVEYLPSFECIPIMLVKQAGSSQAAPNATPSISTAPVSHANYFATVLEAMGADSSSYAESIYSATVNPGSSRIFYHLSKLGILKYEIFGDSRNFDNWHFTGTYWPQ